ncbi:MAG: hypothetical protein A2846_00915 [Candidatus Doudnabacteria bacterium RIFCSPHIGHO2_01_FULL_49_9]|uniref:Kynurenine formamidase n=1 Tax=Candidatus Doudnabacteria bacterium RIFCSPHIGHO2_01_FULL_49_9 TaxID=1817827 RepID=A0A1F5P3M8_9BACT|nr:MAG: hypothetical protein A2846_00915 [Candidatus Doudnabacteria bacterium RIFCSPHIGHO2_01_FULL_49_9]
MKFFDISLPLNSKTISWPGDVRFSREENRGSGITSRLVMSTHTGTHIDAPKHFLFDKPGVDRIDLSKLIGPCRVISLPVSPPREGEIKRGLIGSSHLSKFNIRPGERILIKTRNSSLYKRGKFTSNYVSLSLDGAKYLARKKIALLGIDWLGIEAKSSPGHPVHKILLGAGIVIVEGLDLSKIKPGKYNLAALPLRIVASDGSPCRAILWK